MPIPSRFTYVSWGQKLKEIVQGPTTGRLLIFGTSVDGPKNSPVRVNSISEFERTFGPAAYSRGFDDPVTSTESGKPNYSTLPLAVSQAMSEGCTDIYVCRFTGTTAAATGFGTKLDVRAVYPGRIYNEVTVTLTNASSSITMTIAQPDIKGGNFSTTFGSALSISNVIDSLNVDPRNRTIYLERNTFPSYLSAACTTLSSGSVTLSGGTNGTDAPSEDYASSRTSMASLLYAEDTGALSVIENLPFKFDVAVLTGIYIDDQISDGGSSTTDSIAANLVLWADRVYSNVGPCHVVAATRPHDYRELADIINYINNNLLATSHGAWDTSLRWNKAGPFLNSGWRRNDHISGYLDLGSRLSVVAGPPFIYTHQDIGKYMDNGHVSYAAMLTTAPPEYSVINRSLRGVVGNGTPYPDKYCRLLAAGLGYSDSDTSGLSAKGAYVTFSRNPDNFNGPLVVFDDPTASFREDYGRDSQIMRLQAAIHNTIYIELKGFIGGPTDAATLAAIETKIENVLEGYTKSGGLRGSRGEGYDFTVTMDGNDGRLGIIRVIIEIKPATALRHVFISVGVTN